MPDHDPGPGLGVDRYGGPVVDPTKNVLDLVEAERLRQDGLRDAEARFQTYARGAESARIDQLAKMREEYEARIAGMLRDQLAQVQQSGERRLGELEQFRYAAMLTQSGASRQSMGRSEVVAWFVSGVLLLTTIGTCVAAFLVHH